MLDQHGIGVIIQRGNISVEEAFDLIAAAAECFSGRQIRFVSVGQRQREVVTAGTVLADAQADLGEQLIRCRAEGNGIAECHNGNGQRLRGITGL